jgi:uncharacterized protein YhfF
MNVSLQDSTQAVKQYWQRYLDSQPTGSALPAAPTGIWGFGDSPAMADELGELVRQGVKTATCSLLWEYEADGEAIPQVGEQNIILDGAGQPLCVIKTTEIEFKPYNEVDAQFAHDEGEGDRSLAYWRDAHWRFFSRSCERINRPISQTMPLVCERFRVVFTD